MVEEMTFWDEEAEEEDGPAPLREAEPFRGERRILMSDVRLGVLL